MGMCLKCKKISGGLLLLSGIGFLLQDLAIWNFFGLNWFTVAFIVFGVVKLASAHCKDCKNCTVNGKKK